AIVPAIWRIALLPLQVASVWYPATAASLDSMLPSVTQSLQPVIAWPALQPLRDCWKCPAPVCLPMEVARSAPLRQDLPQHSARSCGHYVESPASHHWHPPTRPNAAIRPGGQHDRQPPVPFQTAPVPPITESSLVFRLSR